MEAPKYGIHGIILINGIFVRGVAFNTNHQRLKVEHLFNFRLSVSIPRSSNQPCACEICSQSLNIIDERLFCKYKENLKVRTPAIHENFSPTTRILVHHSNLTLTHVQLVNMLCYPWYEEYHKQYGPGLLYTE